MRALVDLLAQAVLAGRIKLEEIGEGFGLRAKTEERLKELEGGDDGKA